MARALSQIVTVIRGSIGGITFTANQWHQILLRARTAPVQPQTNPQNWIKDGFNLSSIDWKLMSEPDRQLWKEYGDTVTYTGPMGDYTLPGRQIFMAGQSIVNYVNNAALDTIVVNLDPPEIPGRASFTQVVSQDAGDAGTGFDVSVCTPLGETFQYLMELSPAFNLTRLRYKGPFLSSSAVSAPAPAGQCTLVKFRNLIEGLAYFVRIRGVIVDAPARLTKITILRHVATTFAV